MVTEKQITQIKKRIRVFTREIDFMFEYNNYDLGLVFEKTDFENKAAFVETDTEYLRVVIHIYPCFFEQEKHLQRQLLLHEFAHSFTDALYKIALNLLNGKFESEEHIRRANEQATSRITSILDSLLQGRLRYARKAYEKYID